jgi:hypothetical protein
MLKQFELTQVGKTTSIEKETVAEFGKKKQSLVERIKGRISFVRTLHVDAPTPDRFQHMADVSNRGVTRLF